MYIQGNLAVQPRAEEQPHYRETRRLVKRRKSIPTKEKLLYLFAVAICVCLAGLVIYQYAQIYEINARIQQVDKEIKAIEHENENLQLEANKLSDPKLLIEKAKMLGLRPSEENEISEIPSRGGWHGLHGVALKR